jgi:16S rRNA U516 pseudouridylate synthase RsuA-like enzyme
MKGSLNDAETGQIARETGVRIEPQRRGDNPWYEVTLTEAPRDSLREKLALLGHPVEKMKRIKLANVEIGDVPPGRFRVLSDNEVAGLQKLVAKQAARSGRVGQAGKSPKPKPRPRTREKRKFRNE